MTTYICGPSILRLRGRARAVVPGDRFEHAFTPGEEALALASGAVVAVDAASPAPVPVAPDEDASAASETTRQSARPARVIRRAPVTDNDVTQ